MSLNSKPAEQKATNQTIVLVLPPGEKKAAIHITPLVLDNRRDVSLSVTKVFIFFIIYSHYFKSVART